jgi:cytochrome c5
MSNTRKYMSAALRVACSACVLTIAACSKEDPTFQAGRTVWEANCKVCHEPGLAGAPKFGDKAAWAARIAKGEAVLVDHAINGFEGNSGTMPARGGNAALTDDDIRNAVNYMVHMSQ